MGKEWIPNFRMYSVPRSGGNYFDDPPPDVFINFQIRVGLSSGAEYSDRNRGRVLAKVVILDVKIGKTDARTLDPSRSGTILTNILRFPILLIR